MESELIVRGYFRIKKAFLACCRARSQQQRVFECGLLGLGQVDRHVNGSTLPRVHTHEHADIQIL